MACATYDFRPVAVFLWLRVLPVRSCHGGAAHAAPHCLAYALPWIRRSLQGVADGFPSQSSLLAAVGRPPLIAWPLCPAGGSLVGVGWLSPPGHVRGEGGWGGGRHPPVRGPGAPGPPHSRPRHLRGPR